MNHGHHTTPSSSLREARRLRSCVEQWPDCEDGTYNPRCCRFPKSCSCLVYDPKRVNEADLEPPTTPSSSLMEARCQLTWAGPHGPHGDCPGVTKPWWWSVRFYWREFKNMRRFRLRNERAAHISPIRWRLLEYRFAWALCKRVVQRKLS